MPIVASHEILSFFLPAIEALRETIFDRVLPSFDGIDEESETWAATIRAELLATADEDTDYASLEEHACDEGNIRSSVLRDMKQMVLNLFAVAISHQFDQQRHRLPLTTRMDAPHDKETEREASYDRFLIEAGIDARIHRSGALRELRLVANAVKHGEGSSATKLRRLNPELFIHPLLRDEPSFAVGCALPLSGPLMGENFYVQAEDLSRYLNAVEAYWRMVLEKFDGESHF